MSFQGLRVLALESRRATEIATLIRNQSGAATVAPSMREVPLEANPQAFAFAEALFAGRFDWIILLTGVGARYLHQVLATRYPAERFLEALRALPVVVRGPKPAAVMREWNVPVSIAVPEPNTWRELLAAVTSMTGRRVALQEYGRANPELIAGLTARGYHVTPVPVYQWDVPLDTAPLRDAVRRLAGAGFDVVLFTTSMQVAHLLKIAKEEGCADAVRRGLRRAVIASIGPTTSEALAEAGFAADFEPSHPKMGFLVRETARRAHEILARKRPA